MRRRGMAGLCILLHTALASAVPTQGRVGHTMSAQGFEDDDMQRVLAAAFADADDASLVTVPSPPPLPPPLPPPDPPPPPLRARKSTLRGASVWLVEPGYALHGQAGVQYREEGHCKVNCPRTYHTLNLHQYALNEAGYTRQERMHWLPGDFDANWEYNVPWDYAAKKLDAANIDVVLCYEGWDWKSVPPLYGQLQHPNGEVRQLQGHISAVLGLNQNVLVGGALCDRPLVHNLVGPGKAVMGTFTPSIDFHHAGMEGRGTPRKLAPPCTFGMDYFSGSTMMPSVSTQFLHEGMGHNWEQGIWESPLGADIVNLWNGTQELTPSNPIKEHVITGYLSHCWSAEPPPVGSPLRGNVVFWNKLSHISKMVPCMREQSFWDKMAGVLTATGTKLSVINPYLKGDRRAAFGKVLDDFFVKVNATILPFMSHNQMMGVIRASKMLFGMGQSTGSPTPIDALSCGTPVALPKDQSHLVDMLARLDPEIPAFAFDGNNCDELIHNMPRLIAMKDKHPESDQSVPEYAQKGPLMKYQPFGVLKAHRAFLGAVRDNCYRPLSESLQKGWARKILELNRTELTAAELSMAEADTASIEATEQTQTFTYPASDSCPFSDGCTQHGLADAVSSPMHGCLRYDDSEYSMDPTTLPYWANPEELCGVGDNPRFASHSFSPLSAPFYASG